MIRVTVSYPRTEGLAFDHDYYQTRHRALIESTMTPHGLVRIEMDRCLTDAAGQPSPTMAAAHLLFADLATFKAAMAAAGKEVTADIRNYTQIAPAIVISETTA